MGELNYCCTNRQRRGSCYFEFQRGRFQGIYWKETSIYVDADDFDRLLLYRIFPPEFQYYGETFITASQWHQICLAAREIGGEVQAITAEIDPWARDCFRAEPVFTILGV